MEPKTEEPKRMAASSTNDREASLWLWLSLSELQRLTARKEGVWLVEREKRERLICNIKWKQSYLKRDLYAQPNVEGCPG